MLKLENGATVTFETRDKMDWCIVHAATDDLTVEYTLEELLKKHPTQTGVINAAYGNFKKPPKPEHAAKPAGMTAAESRAQDRADQKAEDEAEDRAAAKASQHSKHK